MNRLCFINTNNNKNAKGYLFFDIILASALFFTMMYGFFIIGLNSFFLLQRLIKNSVEANNRFIIVKALAFNIPHNHYDINVLCNNTIEQYAIETKKIVFNMHNHTKMVADVITVRKKDDGSDNYVCYMMKSE